MTFKLPTFYCMRTLLGFGDQQDLNNVTIYGPNGFNYVLFEMNEPRDDKKSREWSNKLAQELTKLWDDKQ